MSWGEFKASANEVGNWLWGTARGGFNEKQTIGQIMTDAVISMFPISDEVTTAGDVIAAGLRLAQYPEKRQEVVEWVALVLMVIGSDLRARSEEAILVKAFGTTYASYCARTRRFIPGVY